ncbi:MAG: hypothetical protein ACFCU6_15035 [Balneolaceae bacterium]
MKHHEETLTERLVTYSIELDGKFYIVENVPSRVNEETGEQYFAPETVEQLQKTIRGKTKPKKTMETPVFDYLG